MIWYYLTNLSANGLSSDNDKKKLLVRLEAIKNNGYDAALLGDIITKREGITGPAIDLLECMGYDKIRQQAFLGNLFKLNYYGYFLSEGKANSIKTNFLFVKMSRGGDDGSITFSPSKKAIYDFVDEIFSWFKIYNTKYAKDLLAKTNNRTRNQSGLVADDEKGGGHENVYNEVNLNHGWLSRGWESSQHFTTDDHKEIAKANMIYIIKNLCKYLNRDIENRIFFNIVMSQLYLQEERTDRRVQTRQGDDSALAVAVSTMVRQGTLSSPKRSSTDDPHVASPPGVASQGDGGHSAKRTKTDTPGKQSIAHMEFVNRYLTNHPNVATNLGNMPREGTTLALVNRIDYLLPGFLDALKGGKKKRRKRKKKSTKKKKRRRKKKSTKKKKRRRRKKRTRKRR